MLIPLIDVLEALTSSALFLPNKFKLSISISPAKNRESRCAEPAAGFQRIFNCAFA